MYTKWSNSTYTTWNRKTNKSSRYSAGILPYTFDSLGKCLFLLGKDYDNDWSDFGGRCEFKDNNDPLKTACREFYEETLGAVMTIPECMEHLATNPVKILSQTLNGSPYYMYLMYIDYANYIEIFNKTAQFLRYQFDTQEMNKVIEKTTIRWVSIDTIILCIENKQQNAPINLRGVFYKTMINARDDIQFLIKS